MIIYAGSVFVLGHPVDLSDLIETRVSAQKDRPYSSIKEKMHCMNYSLSPFFIRDLTKWSGLLQGLVILRKVWPATFFFHPCNSTFYLY